MTAVEGAITPDDVTEFARGLERPGGWNGASGLYRSLLSEGEELRKIALHTPIEVPAMAIGAFGGQLTSATLEQVVRRPVRALQLSGVGHYAAKEDPDAVASALTDFLHDVDHG